MPPDIRYCTTTDGVRIAYAIEGSGFPVVIVPGWASHLGIDVPRGGPTMQAIRYDKRGTGESDRHLGDYTVETRLLDLEAVVGAAALTRFALVGSSEGGTVAIAYAAKHPDRVSRLILSGSFATGDRTDQDRAVRAALVGLIRAEWGMGSAALSSVFFPDHPEPAVLQWWNRFQREAITADDAAAVWEANGRIDVKSLLSLVRCPTLVIHGRNDRAVPFDRGRELASTIPGARLVADDGPHVDIDPSRAIAMLRFLLEDEYFAVAQASEGYPQGTAIILFADIVDSTALTERMGDAAFRERARALDASLREIISGAGGTAIDGKLLGDGVLATFPAAAQAIDAALRCGAAGEDGGLPLHLGIHAGDVIREANNVFGGAVNIASRISGLSAPGEVLVSDVVRALARTSASVTFEDRGEHALKGVGEPQRVYAVRASRSSGEVGG
jgi:class 3 adenylate cyclase